MPGFKIFKDRVTVLLGANVIGYKFRPSTEFFYYYLAEVLSTFSQTL